MKYIDTNLVLGCFSKNELTELSKLGKTTQFYLVNLVNSEKLIGFTQFYSVNSVPSNACGMVLLRKTNQYQVHQVR